MSTYEIEIKSLLGSESNAKKLKDKIGSKGAVLASTNKQLNHYFTINDQLKFEKEFGSHIPQTKTDSFKKILSEGSGLSVRTRDADGKVIFIVKASLDDDTSANGVSRMEFELEMEMSLENLDRLLLDAGLEYEAKWSREREEYKLGDVNICLDKNAGYGYVAEFEKIISDPNKSDKTKDSLKRLMDDLGVEELMQDRLERMFAYYNSNWRDYYGTNKVFNIK